MRGTKRQVREGVWRLRVVKGYRIDGQPIQASLTIKGTERQADTALAKFVTEMEAGSVTASGRMTYAQFVDTMYVPHIEANLGLETVRTQRSRLEKIKTELGHVRLDKLSAAHLDAAYAKWRSPRRSKPVRNSTIRGYHLVISASLRQAVRWGLVASSVAPSATLPPVEHRDDTTPTLQQITALIEGTVKEDPVLSAAIMIAALTGARRGEIAGLQWKDIDRAAMFLRIERGIVRGEEGRPAVGPTKTRTRRRLSIDEMTLAVLDAHRERCEEWARQSGLTLTNDCFIVTWDPSGRNPTNGNVITAHFRNARDRLGIEGVRFHDLRHAVATTLLSQGYDPAVVAGRLGHSSPAVTMRIYAHALEERDRQAAGVMGSLLASTK